MATQGTLKDVAMGVDKAREEGYAWENINGYMDLRTFIDVLSRRDGGDTAIVSDGNDHIGL